ncbi:MAG: molybdopterin-guanine dinucleotide biosynthesis protein MobB [Desulfovibrionales bacterium]|nr:molybdopterin-guanine dinucleotide biosynthesis protein MobB [Desulfovibrionales bacterium]
MFKAVSVVGFKKSGKTTLVLELARELSRLGRKVAAVKFTEHGLDMNGTDTARFAQECVCVAGMGSRQTSLCWNASRPLQDVLPLLGADVVLVEGGKSLTWLPRIVVLGADEDEASLDRGLALASWGTGELAGVRPAASIAELASLVDARGFTLPGLDCGACGRESCHALAQEIVAGKADTHACLAMQPKLSVRIGGRQLSLNPFIDRMVTSTLRGLLTELKGNVPGQRVEITLD